jgi:2-dehydro-3-deoxygluconokinase
VGHFDLLAIGEPMVEFNQTGGTGSRSYLQGFRGDTSNAVIAARSSGGRSGFSPSPAGRGVG